MKEKAQNLACVILAAGMGTRMRSALPKVMHKVAGIPMVMSVINTALSCKAQKVVVVTSPSMHGAREEIKAAYPKLTNAVQQRQLGTGDAVKSAMSALANFSGNVVVLYGDSPLITRETIQSMTECLNESSKTAIVVLGMEVTEPNAYGRIVLNKKNNIEKIVEEKDASKKEKKITLCNSGVMAMKAKLLLGLLARLNNKNAKGEYYLTDIVKLARKDGYNCAVIKACTKELIGVNSRVELAQAEAIAQERLRQKAMESGVTLIDPASVYFAHDTKLGKDVIIHPHVVFGSNVRVEDHVEIRSFSHIDGAVIHEHATIGPFARIRPGSEIGEAAHVGNFVELKKSKLEKGVKVNHLSYVGDSHVGEKTNIGAGTITCNYDGKNKYKTEIGAHVFIGSNTALVAPVTVGDGAVIAAGSVVTEDVDPHSLVIARVRQEEKRGWAKKNKK